MFRVLIIFAFLGFGAFISNSAIADEAGMTLDDATSSAVVRSVEAKLIDPSSARFEQIRAAHDPANGRLVVCGLVNAKNSFGGYVGRTPFVARQTEGEGQFFTFIGGSETARASAVRICKDLGILLD